MLVHILLQAETVKHDDGHTQCGTHAINRSPETVRLVRGSRSAPRVRSGPSATDSRSGGSAFAAPPPPGAAPRVRSGGFAVEPSAQRPPPGPVTGDPSPPRRELAAREPAAAGSRSIRSGLGDPRDALSPEIHIFHEQITRPLSVP